MVFRCAPEVYGIAVYQKECSEIDGKKETEKAHDSIFVLERSKKKFKAEEDTMKMKNEFEGNQNYFESRLRKKKPSTTLTTGLIGLGTEHFDVIVWNMDDP